MQHPGIVWEIRKWIQFYRHDCWPWCIVSQLNRNNDMDPSLLEIISIWGMKLPLVLPLTYINYVVFQVSGCWRGILCLLRVCICRKVCHLKLFIKRKNSSCKILSSIRIDRVHIWQSGIGYLLCLVCVSVHLLRDMRNGQVSEWKIIKWSFTWMLICA